MSFVPAVTVVSESIQAKVPESAIYSTFTFYCLGFTMKESICFGILVLLCPCVTSGIQLRCCRKPPPLIINGKDIFKEKQGIHMLVAFVEGSNKDSRKQVKGLDLLLNNFKNM